MQNNQPLVSVIMNCFNGEEYLREAIDSVIAQTYTNWEIIFWDNQSVDRSAEIFKSYNDSHFRYFYAPKHTLLYEARNCAIEKSCGEYFAFLDVDDTWSENKLEKQIPLFVDEKVGFVCSNYWIVDEVRITRKLFRKRLIPSGWVLRELLSDYPVGLLTLVVRRTAFDELGSGCDSRFHIIGDMDLVVRLAKNWKMGSCQASLAHYRIHGENEGKKQKVRNVAEYQIWVDELRKSSDIYRMPEFKKVVEELLYMQGLLNIDQNNKAKAWRQLRQLSWGNYKLKLLVSLVMPQLFLRLLRH